jgi:hypothetical protein
LAARPPLRPLPCPSCAHVMGHTDGERLYLGVSCYALQTVTLHCSRDGCGGRLTWRAWSLPSRRRDGRD